MTAARFLLRKAMRRKQGTVEDDTLLGGLVGVLAGTTFGTALGATGGMLAFGATLGLLTGFVVGMLVWLETADLPEDPIPPVRPSAPRTRR